MRLIDYWKSLEFGGTMAGKRDTRPPLRLKTWKEAREYFAARLTPVTTNRAGWPVYKSEDIKRLNVLLPDENVNRK